MPGAAFEQTRDLARQVANHEAAALRRAALVAELTLELDGLIAELVGPAYVGTSRLTEIGAALTRLRLVLDEIA